MDNNNDIIYNAKELGTGKTLLLGLQHMFAMFGATVLVPIITGLSVSSTLLFAGIATLFMHLVTGRRFLYSWVHLLPSSVDMQR